MNSAGSGDLRGRQRPPRRIDARIDISPSGVRLNGEPVELMGTEEWLAAGVRAASQGLAQPLRTPIRAQVVNGPCRTRLVIHPDGSVSDVKEYVVPAWLKGVVGGELLARQRIPLIAVTAAVGAIALVGGLVLTSDGERPEASQAAAPTTGTTSAGVGDLRQEVMYAAPAPVVVAASMTGGRRAVVMEAAAEPRVEARWILRDPDGRLVVDRVVTLDAEPRRFRRSGLPAGEYRWSLAPRGEGETRRGTVTVTRKGAEPSTDAPASPDETSTPGSSPSSPDAPAAPGGRSGSVPTPEPDPTTPKSKPTKPAPTTSEPDPTTSDPDPTTSDPDPTTSDPTTSDPDPTASESDTTSSAPTTSQAAVDSATSAS